MPHDQPLFSFGIAADCQYADADDLRRGKMDRRFRESRDRLAEAVETWNGHDLAFIVHLGDLIDRDPADAPVVLDLFAQCTAPVHQLLGNHDFANPSGVPTPTAELCAAYGMPAAYYEFAQPGWRFLVLDGNAISIEGNAPGTPRRVEAERVMAELEAAGARNARPWNGGLGSEQEEWLAARLAEAETAGERVAVLVHHPLDDTLGDSLWFGSALADRLAASPVVSVVLSGHHHAGMFRQVGELPLLGLQGMVETAESAYAIAHVHADTIMIEGFRREPSRILPLRAV